mmetsp:Transcript_42453/g.98353  ORF Transcript_42453/g.98353 Transcript_42453/m.98353 type:complete len:213 (+) Transcript_42453:587-1225(+)
MIWRHPQAHLVQEPHLVISGELLIADVVYGDSQCLPKRQQKHRVAVFGDHLVRSTTLPLRHLAQCSPFDFQRWQIGVGAVSCESPRSGASRKHIRLTNDAVKGVKVDAQSVVVVPGGHHLLSVLAVQCSAHYLPHGSVDRALRLLCRALFVSCRFSLPPVQGCGHHRRHLEREFDALESFSTGAVDPRVVVVCAGERVDLLRGVGRHRRVTS